MFEHGANQYELKHESTWSSAFVLSRNGIGRVGSIKRKGFIKRERTVELPEELPLEVRVFIIWLVVILWKRAESAAGGAVGAVGAGG